MNTPPLPANESPIIRRVRNISQVLKVLLVSYLVILPLSVLAISSLIAGVGLTAKDSTVKFASLSPWQEVVAAGEIAIYLVGAVAFYRLLNLYEAGIFFSRANVRLFRWLAYLALGKGVLVVVASLSRAVLMDTGTMLLPVCLFDILGSPWVVGGLAGVMISFIMDEGCKLREEQELTV